MCGEAGGRGRARAGHDARRPNRARDGPTEGQADPGRRPRHTRELPGQLEGYTPGALSPPRRASPSNPHLSTTPAPGCPQQCEGFGRGDDREAKPRNPAPAAQAWCSAIPLPGAFHSIGITAMPQITMRQMLEAGVHFGHQTRYWNPKMAPVHLRCPRQDPHHQPREDRPALQRRDELHLRPCPEARHHPVRRHQALGARPDQGRSRPVAACRT